MNKITFTSRNYLSDSTTDYDIKFPKGMIVSEFVATALKEGSDKWGSFQLDNPFGQTLVEYSGGEIHSHCADFVTKYRDKIVIEAKANGGWGNMDYYLTLGDPEPDAIITFDKDEYWGQWIICGQCQSQRTPAGSNYCCNCGHRFEVLHRETRIEYNERHLKHFN